MKQRSLIAKKPKILDTKIKIFEKVLSNEKLFQVIILSKHPEKAYYMRINFSVGTTVYQLFIQRYVWRYPKINYIEISKDNRQLLKKEVQKLYQEIAQK